jgi:hypothetical protein
VFGFGELFGRPLVGNTHVANIVSDVEELSSALCDGSAGPDGQSPFKVEQSLLVVLNIHEILPWEIWCSCLTTVWIRVGRRRIAFRKRLLDGFVERGLSTSSFRSRRTDVRVGSCLIAHAHLDDGIVILLP